MPTTLITDGTGKTGRRSTGRLAHLGPALAVPGAPQAVRAFAQV